jgi:predicted nucleic acid-binding protein
MGTEALTGSELIAPSLVPFEAADIIRRHDVAGVVGEDQAAQAHADLLDLWPYELLAPRAWELRHNLTIADASYVALAELATATLVTLDRRIGAAGGARAVRSRRPVRRRRAARTWTPKGGASNELGISPMRWRGGSKRLAAMQPVSSPPSS